MQNSKVTLKKKNKIKKFWREAVDLTGQKKKSAGKDTAGKNVLGSLTTALKMAFSGFFHPSEPAERLSSSKYLATCWKSEFWVSLLGLGDAAAAAGLDFPGTNSKSIISPSSLLLLLGWCECSHPTPASREELAQKNHRGSTKQTEISWRIKRDWTVFTF